MMRRMPRLLALTLLVACGRDQANSGTPAVDSTAMAPVVDSSPPAPKPPDVLPADTVMARDTARAL